MTLTLRYVLKINTMLKPTGITEETKNLLKQSINDFNIWTVL